MYKIFTSFLLYQWQKQSNGCCQRVSNLLSPCRFSFRPPTSIYSGNSPTSSPASSRASRSRGPVEFGSWVLYFSVYLGAWLRWWQTAGKPSSTRSIGNSYWVRLISNRLVLVKKLGHPSGRIQLKDLAFEHSAWSAILYRYHGVWLAWWHMTGRQSLMDSISETNTR